MVEKKKKKKKIIRVVQKLCKIVQKTLLLK
jgi:hypothetical protein